MPSKKTEQPKDKKTVGTTGHAWDGIEEYNNPLPMWWLWVFAVCVLVAIGYVIYYPAIPLMNSFTQGVGGWSQYNQLQDIQQRAAATKAPYEEKISRMTVHQVAADQELRGYAIESGRATFALHCSQCHGAGAGGAKGYPSLLDDEWIWGGRLEDIVYTITHGIRGTEEDENSRDMGPMMAYGDEEVLTPQEIKDVVYYVKTLSKPHLPKNEAVARGKETFASTCAACHGPQGQGMREVGAPPLNNAIWLYGGDTATMVETITHGRAGQMPVFGAKLTADEIKKLAVYVHSLGGGE